MHFIISLCTRTGHLSCTPRATHAQRGAGHPLSTVRRTCHPTVPPSDGSARSAERRVPQNMPELAWLHPSIVSSFVASHAQELESKARQTPCVRLHQAIHAMQLLQWRSIWQQSNQQRDEQKLSSRPPTATDDHQVANILISLAASHYGVRQSGGSQGMSLQTIKEEADTETLMIADIKADPELLFPMEL